MSGQTSYEYFPTPPALIQALLYPHLPPKGSREQKKYILIVYPSSPASWIPITPLLRQTKAAALTCALPKGSETWKSNRLSSINLANPIHFWNAWITSLRRNRKSFENNLPSRIKWRLSKELCKMKLKTKSRIYSLGQATCRLMVKRSWLFKEHCRSMSQNLFLLPPW